jgi:hypothetical protein
MVIVPARQGTYAGGIDSLESIPWNQFLGFLNVEKFGLFIHFNCVYNIIA